MKPFLVAAAILLALPVLAAAQEALDVKIMFCMERECVNQKDFFYAGEGAYIDYNSTLKGITYAAFLIHPDGTRQQITFANRVISNVTANYTIEMTVWKDGYNETKISRTLQFVEAPSLPAQSNPPVLDWMPLAVVAGAAVIAFAAWRVYKKKPEGKG